MTLRIHKKNLDEKIASSKCKFVVFLKRQLLLPHNDIPPSPNPLSAPLFFPVIFLINEINVFV